MSIFEIVLAAVTMPIWLCVLFLIVYMPIFFLYGTWLFVIDEIRWLLRKTK